MFDHHTLGCAGRTTCVHDTRHGIWGGFALLEDAVGLSFTQFAHFLNSENLDTFPGRFDLLNKFGFRLSIVDNESEGRYVAGNVGKRREEVGVGENTNTLGFV